MSATATDFAACSIHISRGRHRGSAEAHGISNFWGPAKDRLGLVGVRFHDLRHTAVALAIAMGAHPKSIQARMGHSSVQVTLDRYGHLFPELDAAIATGLDATLRTSLRVFDGGLEDTPRTQRSPRS